MESKPINQVKIGVGSSVRAVIRYTNMLIKERNLKSVNFSAIGGAIGKLLNVVEVIKTLNPGLYQVNTIGTVSYQSVDNHGLVSTKRLFPKLDVVLTTDEPTEKGEGFQTKLTEEERTKLLEALRSSNDRNTIRNDNLQGSRGNVGQSGRRGPRGRPGQRGRGGPKGRPGPRGK